MANANNQKDKSFNVVDKRFWVKDQDEGTSDTDEETSPDKPGYVIELEQAIGEKDKILQGVIAQHKETLAEFDKAKDRLSREVAREVERNRRALIVDFLDVVDNLERALASADAAETESAMAQGVAMVRDLFLRKLADHGVRRIEAIGQLFDPSKHEALTVMPLAHGQVAGQIVSVIRQGYTIDDEILRAAGVAVAQEKGPGA